MDKQLKISFMTLQLELNADVGTLNSAKSYICILKISEQILGYIFWLTLVNNVYVFVIVSFFKTMI